MTNVYFYSTEFLYDFLLFLCPSSGSRRLWAAGASKAEGGGHFNLRLAGETNKHKTQLFVLYYDANKIESRLQNHDDSMTWNKS